ncbi:cyanophycinase [Flavisolibacter nicotianae]|uniref:cyanophycinase n=1 Tax=Flavisolibacter nicotianae TaxID=2364882 RepID=UPI0013C48685|nr:cyanophycinase [Flavisolibacter nicotianae]
MKVKQPGKRSIDKKSKENHAPIPAGVLVVIGGKENKGEEAPENKKKPADFIKLEVLQAFKDATHKREPVVEIITTASSEGAESFNDYKHAFEKIGISTVGHIHHATRQEVLDDPLEERIKRADAFFFSGGDQLLLTAIYGGTQFLTALKERYIHEPVVIAGTSAGAMALSTPMIYAGSQDVQELGGEIKVAMGLEFLKDVCIDTHFVHRGRFVRMAQVVITNPTSIGIGIEEDTCIIVKNGRDLLVMGSGLVVVIEGFQIQEANIKRFSEDKPITARNLSVHLLADGDTYTISEVNPPHK